MRNGWEVMNKSKLPEGCIFPLTWLLRSLLETSITFGGSPIAGKMNVVTRIHKPVINSELSAFTSFHDH